MFWFYDQSDQSKTITTLKIKIHDLAVELGVFNAHEWYDLKLLYMTWSIPYLWLYQDFSNKTVHEKKSFDMIIEESESAVGWCLKKLFDLCRVTVLYSIRNLNSMDWISMFTQ